MYMAEAAAGDADAAAVEACGPGMAHLAIFHRGSGLAGSMVLDLAGPWDTGIMCHSQQLYLRLYQPRK